MTKPVSTTRPVGLTEARPVYKIAQEIFTKWGDKMSPHAEPYVNAMLNMTSPRDNYYEDSGKSIILYFLSNAQGWRGPDAQRIKAELKAMVGSK